MSAKRGWIGLCVYVVIVDAWLIRSRRQTLSSAFAEAVRHPRRRWKIIAAWAYLTLHLFGHTHWLERHLTWRRK